MSRIIVRLILVFLLNHKKHKAMAKPFWGTILKVIIAVASAIAGALGYSALG